jgi:hypothetical protein
VARLHDIQSHRPTHIAQSDKPDAHQTPPGLLTAADI